MCGETPKWSKLGLARRVDEKTRVWATCPALMISGAVRRSEVQSQEKQLTAT